MEGVVELLVQIGMICCFFGTPITFSVSVIGILKSYHRRLVIPVAVLSVVPWVIYGSMLLLLELGFGPPPVPENAPPGVAIGHVFQVLLGSAWRQHPYWRSLGSSCSLSNITGKSPFSKASIAVRLDFRGPLDRWQIKTHANNRRRTPGSQGSVRRGGFAV
jgi:hypothetical protein